jgi:Domain of unknown function (DUF4105)
LIAALAISASLFFESTFYAEWKRSLFYSNSWSGEKSLIDDNSFFLSEAGKRNAKIEFEIFFKKISEQNDESLTLQCDFPLRTDIIKQWQNTLPEEKKTPIIWSKKCKELDLFLGQTKSTGVGLVFSSYYPNNPGSLFGHTFLRFSKQPSENNKNSNLNDMGLNFSAYPTTNNNLLYVIYGLSGMFPGYFDMSPFYVKVQEYNHAENRDLWDYHLNLNEAQVKKIMLAAWEIRKKNIDYFYFDDNCSLLMLKMLEIANPKLELTKHFYSWVIPSDTMRALNKEPNLIQKIEFRSSTLRKLESMYASLSNEQKEIFQKIKSEKKIEINLQKDIAFKQKILDTVAEFIEYDEKLAGSKESVAWANLRREALQERSKLGKKEYENEIKIPEKNAPHLGLGPTSLGVGWATNKNNENLVYFDWNPALHRLGRASLGYSHELEVTFFNPKFLWNIKQKKPRFESFKLLEVLSAREFESLLKQPAWNISFAADRKWFLKEFQTEKDFGLNLRRNVSAGIGLAKSFFNEENRIFSMFNLQIGFQRQIKYFLAPGIHVGAFSKITNNIYFRGESYWNIPLYDKKYPLPSSKIKNLVLASHEATLSFLLGSNSTSYENYTSPKYELQIHGVFEKETFQARVSAHVYF